MKLSEAISRLSDAGIENARLDARTIFEKIGKIPSWQLVGRDVECNDRAVDEAIMRRAAREPLQYLIGEVSFYNEVYKVTPNCLIPRQDTEILVDYAVKNLTRGARLLDICTGSGCIAISVVKNLADSEAIALDVSAAALSLAKENAIKNEVAGRVRFLRHDALSGELPSGVSSLDAILSNPPYVSDSVYPTLEQEIFHEPKIAFTGGNDGADFYRAITPLYMGLLRPNGFIAYEIGYDQAEIINSIAKDNRLRCEILSDLSGNPRVAVLRRKDR